MLCIRHIATKTMLVDAYLVITMNIISNNASLLMNGKNEVKKSSLDFIFLRLNITFIIL